MSRPITLSKSRFTAGLQCHKFLWWRVHEPDAPELTAGEAQQATFDTGTRVGVVARGYLGPGVLIEGEPWDKSTKTARTRDALAAGATRIFEASFEHGGVFAAVDALERHGEEFHLIEVKSSASLKKEQLPDVAVQRWVLAGAGLNVTSAEVMHLNRECRAPDLSNLFERSAATAESDPLLAEVGDEVAAQFKMLAGPLPTVAVGDQCTKPYLCPFYDRCWKDVPKHHISTLMNLSEKKKHDFAALGVETIDEIPLDYKLTERQEVQRRAVRAGQITVAKGELRRELAKYEAASIAFLDFETVAEAIPVWDGCRPYDAVPVQMSVHVLKSDGTLTHTDWIAEGSGDPRRECATRVVAACKESGAVVVYHKSMEEGCLKRLAAAVPELGAALEDIVARIVDMEQTVQAGVYHPDFLGSYSLKPVVGALLPELAYDDLEVGEGTLASVRLRRLMFDADSIPAAERGRMRQELLDYCGRDTLVMVKLLDKLRSLV